MGLQMRLAIVSIIGWWLNSKHTITYSIAMVAMMAVMIMLAMLAMLAVLAVLAIKTWQGKHSGD